MFNLADDEAALQPDQKKMKFDVAEPVVQNLAGFPVEILERIFVRLDDIGLLHLSSTCLRFVDIAQTVFRKRYEDRHFVINDECKGGDPEVYTAQFNQFGDCIKAIQINGVRHINSVHWLTKLLQPHITTIEKLALDSCHFKSNDFLAQPLHHITHLTFRHISFGSSDECKCDLPDCRLLQELEIYESLCFSNKSLRQMVRNNPALERLVLNHTGNIVLYMDWFEIVTLIANHLGNVKELTLIDFIFTEWRVVHTNAIDAIVNSLKHLESLSLSVTNGMLGLVQRLTTKYKSLTHLALLNYDNDFDNDIFRSFIHIESLHLTYDPSWAAIDSPLGHLPKLHQLGMHIENEYVEYTENMFTNVLALFRMCSSLQQITIVFRYGCDAWIEDVVDAKLYQKFMEIVEFTEKSHARIDIEEYGRVIASISIDGIVWRNKRMHWTDCDKIATHIHLLDLAEESTNRMNLLDKICDYLDLDSLGSLARTCKRGKQLVESYAEKHSNGTGTFFITDEFYSFENYAEFEYVDGFEDSENFWAPFVTHLSVDIQRCDFKFEIGEIIASFPFLEKLWINDQYQQEHWPIVPTDLSHIVYSSAECMNYSNLSNVIESFPQIEIIELKNAGLFNDFEPDDCNHIEKFGNLKTLAFNYRGEVQANNLKEIFKNTLTQLVPILPNGPK